MRHWCFTLFLLALLFPAARAGAGVRLHAPEGTVVHAGDMVELRWDGLDRGIREVEFELSLDGGRWVRISPEMHALEGSWRWCVPAISAERARIRLRGGGEGREEVAAVGGEFRMVATPATSADRDFLGEWWPALDTHALGAAGPRFCGGHEAAFAIAGQNTPASVPASPSLLLPPDDGVMLHAAHILPISAPVFRARSARPPFVPLRN